MQPTTQRHETEEEKEAREDRECLEREAKKTRRELRTGVVHDRDGGNVVEGVDASAPDLDTYLKPPAAANLTRRLRAIDPRLLDPSWRLNNLYKVIDKRGKSVKFKPNIFQEAILKNLHYLNIVVKARQLGISTFMAIVALDQCLFNSNFNAAIIADKETNSNTLFSRLEYAWEQFDPKIKSILGLDTTSDTKTMIRFSNGSSARVGTTVHGGTYQLLHISEFGPLCVQSPDKAATLLKSALPTVPVGSGITVVESTAEGEGNRFEDLAVEALKDTQRAAEEGRKLFPNEWQLFFFAWFQNPEYQFDASVTYHADGSVKTVFSADIEAYADRIKEECGHELTPGQKVFYASKLKELGPEDVLTQYPASFEDSFRASGTRYFSAHLLDRLINDDATEPDRRLSFAAINAEEAEKRGDTSLPVGLMVWKPYVRGHIYGIGADVSAGVSKDSSAAAVIDFSTREVVATYRNNRIKPEDFAYELRRIGLMYGGCIIAPEVNLMGYTTCVILNTIYPNVYFHVLQGYAEDKQTERIGFLTNASTKQKFLQDLNAAISDPEHRLRIRDKNVLQEMRYFKKEDAYHRQETAQTTKLKTRHFDLLTATAIAWQMRDFAGDGGFNNPEQEQRIHMNRQRKAAGSNKFL